jgi:hypothetical protein
MCADYTIAFKPLARTDNFGHLVALPTIGRIVSIPSIMSILRILAADAEGNDGVTTSKDRSFVGNERG